LKKLRNVIIIGFILVIAAVTNPSKEKFVIWAKDQLKGKYNNGLVNMGIEVLGDGVINSVTNSSNYVFFTVYDSKISASKDIKVLGVFNNFIPLSNSSGGNGSS
jgi:hypothetical protein